MRRLEGPKTEQGIRGLTYGMPECSGDRRTMTQSQYSLGASGVETVGQ
jgi:hypothetical protein